MNEISSATSVGFIGLGLMGKSMARNLIKTGFQVRLYNRSGAVLAVRGAIPHQAMTDPVLSAGRAGAP